MANSKVAPVFYNQSSAQHTPMTDGTVIDPKFIDAGALISNDEGNLIVEGSDGGVRLTAEDLICDTGNCNNLIQVCDDGKIYVAPQTIVSEDDGNILKEGSDGGAYLNPGDMVGGERDNQLVLDDDNKFYVPPQNIVSKMDGNVIIEDRADGSAYLSPDMVLSKDDNALELGSDGGIKLDPEAIKVQVVSKMDGNVIIEDRADKSAYLSTDMLLSKDDNALELGSDGGIKLDPEAIKVQVVSKEEGNLIVEDRSDKSAYLGYNDVVSKDRGNLIVEGTDGKLRLSGTDAVSTTRGNLLSVSDGGRLEVLGADLLSDVECNVLDVDKEGKLELCLDIKYNKITGDFDLIGNDGAVIKTIQVPSAASLLVGAQLEKDPIGQDPGYYIKMAFKMADGSIENIYVDVSALSDIYTGGKGISIHDYTVEVRLAPYKSGLSFDKDGCLQADFVTLAGDGLVVEEDRTSLGYQFAVYCCDGLHYVDSVITDVTTGELIDKKYVGINLHPDEQILGLVGKDGDHEDCPYLAAYISLKAAGDKLITVDRNGKQVGNAITLGAGLDATGDKISQDFSLKANGDKLTVNAGDGSQIGDAITLAPGLDATGNKISPDFSLKADGDKLTVNAGDGSQIGGTITLGSGLDATNNVIKPDLTLKSSGNKLAVNAADGTQLGNAVPLKNGLESTADGGVTINTVDTFTENDDRPISSNALKNHSSTSLMFGGGTSNKYGHVELTDSLDSTAGADKSVGLSAAAGATLAKRIKALEDAPSGAGGFEYPVVKNWTQGYYDGGNRSYYHLGNLYAPSNSPYYAVFTNQSSRGSDPGVPNTPAGTQDFTIGDFVGIYKAGAHITGTYVGLSCRTDHSAYAARNNFFLNIINNWSPRTTAETARYMYMEGTPDRWSHSLVHFFLAKSNNYDSWVERGGAEGGDFPSITTLFDIKCIPLEGGTVIGAADGGTYFKSIYPSFQ